MLLVVSTDKVAIMRLINAAMISLAFLALPIVAWSKGETVQIDIDGGDLALPIEITDPAIISRFNIWNGPGVSTSSYGVPDPPAYLDSIQPAGRFIDWPKGVVETRPEDLDRYRVTFQIASRGNAPHSIQSYRVMYEIGPDSDKSYMYLPTFSDPNYTGGLIYHGVEGNWFYSSASWEALVRPIIESSNAEGRLSTE
jgi:hypothetical protein